VKPKRYNIRRFDLILGILAWTLFCKNLHRLFWFYFLEVFLAIQFAHPNKPSALEPSIILANHAGTRLQRISLGTDRLHDEQDLVAMNLGGVRSRCEHRVQDREHCEQDGEPHERSGASVGSFRVLARLLLGCGNGRCKERGRVRQSCFSVRE
jgi:hypothetical protein